MDRSFEKRLRQVPWQERKTVSGDARHIPDAIMGLLSADPTVRQRSYWRIDNHVVVQSDLYEAAYDVVPFLVEIVADKSVPGRDVAYKALFELANGYPVPRDARVMVSGQSVPVRQAIRAALLPHREIFERDLRDPKEDIRRDAFDLLERLAEDD